jgi:hypothetical protein
MAANPTLRRWAQSSYVFTVKFAIGLALSIADSIDDCGTPSLTSYF